MTALAHSPLNNHRTLTSVAGLLAQFPAQPVSPVAERPRILHVDDSPLMCSTFRFLLRNHQCFIESTSDGQSALDLIKADLSRYSCIVTDHDMPGMHGLDFVRALRKTAFSGRIVLFSSYVPKPCREEYHAEGVHEIFTKGADTRRLSALLQTIG